MFLALFLGGLTVFKLWLARFLPLLGDEAYYNLWARLPDWSYVDHPPMVAYLHWLVNLFGPGSDFAVRVGAIILLLVSTWLIYLVGKEAYDRKVGIAAAVVFNLIPTYLAGGLFLTPEHPLIICWLLATYGAVKLFKTNNKNYWYLIGLGTGLGLLSKYPMVLFAFGLLLFLAISKENRNWFRRKETYLAGLIALALFSPVLIWNYQHGFPSLAYHSARIGNPNYGDNILTFLVLQFIMFSPPLFFFTLGTFLGAFRDRLGSHSEMNRLLISLSLPALLAFLLVSPFTVVGGHWTSTAYLGMIILLSAQLMAAAPPLWKLWRFWFNLGLIIFINVLFISYYAFLYPIPQELTGKAYSINHELPVYIKQSQARYVFSNQMGVGSLVAYYGQTMVYLPKHAWPQFDVWGRPTLKPGDSILYFVFDDQGKAAKLKGMFQSITVDPQPRLFAKDSDIPLKTQALLCRGYKKGELP